MRRAIWCCILSSAALIGCERKASDDALPADTAVAAPAAATDTGADSQVPATGSRRQFGALFDPLRVKQGDRIGAFEVAANKTQAAPQARVGVTGSVAFDGEAELMGSYRAHFDYPEMKEACFWVDVSDWRKLPRAQNDDRIKWFCFTNKEQAIRELGALGTETRATVVISDYTTNLETSDVWDTAKLVRVVKKGI